MFVGFDTFFIKFHELFFSNDDWLFNPATDPIINVLPEQFFMYCFILFFILIEIFFLVPFLLGRRELKRSSHN
jgi:integral membrane protein (TIGR01906 family)